MAASHPDLFSQMILVLHGEDAGAWMNWSALNTPRQLEMAWGKARVHAHKQKLRWVPPRPADEQKWASLLLMVMAEQVTLVTL